MKLRNETLKQTLILDKAKTVLIVTVSVPHMANAKPIHMVKVIKTVLHTVQINFHAVDVNKFRYIQTHWIIDFLRL